MNLNKSEFLAKIRELVGEGDIESALDLLSEHIEVFAAYFSNDIFMLKGQVQAAKKQFILQGIIGNVDYNRTIARVNLAILELVGKIEKKTETQNNRRRGHIMHKIPSTMITQSETKCIVRIAYNLEKLFINLAMDEDTVFQEIQITEVMSVELIDNNEITAFKIRTCTDEEQFIISEEYTQWIFYVRPIREGLFPLLLKLVVSEVINGKERKRNIVLEKDITVTNIKNELILEFTSFTVITLDEKRYIEERRAEFEKLLLEELEKVKGIKSGVNFEKEHLQEKGEEERLEEIILTPEIIMKKVGKLRLEKITMEKAEKERLEKIMMEKGEEERLEERTMKKVEKLRLEIITMEKAEKERLEKIMMEKAEKERLEKIMMEKEKQHLYEVKKPNGSDFFDPNHHASCFIIAIFIMIIIILGVIFLFKN